MKVSINYYQVQEEFHSIVFKVFSTLTDLKESGDRTAFNNALMDIIPQLKQYINTRLQTAIRKGHFSRHKYKSNDFIDQLFIEVYDCLEEIENEHNFYTWLFMKTNELLEDTIIEEEFDDYFFKNIDEYTVPQWAEMEEHFTVDAGGDFLMVDELDDLFFSKSNYTLNHVFVRNDENDIVDKLDKELSEKRVQNHVKMVLHKLPLPMRMVFDLSTNHKFSIEEVGKITNTSKEEVEKLLEEASKALKMSIFNRFDSKQ